jgi:hypothetical protein
MTESTTPDPELASELEEEPYNPATGHLEPPLIPVDAQSAAAHDSHHGHTPPSEEDLEEQPYNPATGHIETQHTPAIEDPS